MTPLAWTVTILGLVATIIGSLLAFMTYISPIVRLRAYLRRPKKWEKVSFDLNGNDSIWRYTPHPEFTIEDSGESKEWAHGVTENWMKYPLPDPSKYSSKMQAKVNGQTILAEEFISLDGGRYLVPLPRVGYAENKKDNEYWYDEVQIMFANIIGTYYRMNSIEEFIKHQELDMKNTHLKWYYKLIP